MLNWLRSRTPAAKTATKLYGSIVTQARSEKFYLALGVPDTPEGRFELLLAHLSLVLLRLDREGQAGREAARSLIEAFISDMDDCLREMGVGDLTVPRRVKKAAAALYERRDVYAQALAQHGDDALSGALSKHVYGAATEHANARHLARHLRSTAMQLAGHPRQSLLAGDLTSTAAEKETVGSSCPS